MNELLQASAGVISQWLEASLPSLSANWWVEHGVKRLTFQQQRFVEDRRIQALSGLDLAAILRVLDQNWNELAVAHPLPREGRNWVKELQSVRNRWAHAPAGGIGPTDAFRDADTLERLLVVVGAGPDLMKSVEAFKTEALARLAPSQPETPRAPGKGGAQAASHAAAPAPAPSAPTSMFSVGQLLCLRSNPAAVFPVLDVLPSGAAETRYRVFENGIRQIYYESQLKALDEPANERKVLTASEFSSLLLPSAQTRRSAL
jgi:hypothetical protein